MNYVAASYQIPIQVASSWRTHCAIYLVSTLDGLFGIALVEVVNRSAVLVIFGGLLGGLGVTGPFDIAFDSVAVSLLVQDFLNFVIDVVVNFQG